MELCDCEKNALAEVRVKVPELEYVECSLKGEKKWKLRIDGVCKRVE